MRGSLWLQCGLCLGLFSLRLSPAFAAVELGQPVGELSVLDARDKPLVVRPNQDRAAIAILFLSARSEAVDKAIDNINQLFRKHRRLGVVYIGVCSNKVESAAELGDYSRDRGMIFSIYRDPEAVIAGKIGISEIPSVALINAEGKLVHRGGLESPAGQLAFDAAVTENVKPRGKLAEETSSKPTPIAKPGAKQQARNVYGSLSYSSEFLFEQIPGAAVYHCSTITQAANGDLLCLWYGGSYESADDQSLFLARRKAGERMWQAPEVLIAGPDPLPGNGVIFTDGMNHVQIVWCRMETERPIGRGQGWDNCRLMSRTSTDHGKSWSKDAELLSPDLRAVPRNPPIKLSNGNLILPMEADLNQVEGSIFLIGLDGGKTWKQGGFTPGGSQPAVIERKDKTLFSLMRKAPRITQIESSDGGESWTPAVASQLRNPNSGITMTRLANGHLVVVFNDSDNARTPLSVARSIDEGKSWETPLKLESNPGEYSYPCVIQTADGKIHVSYTYRRYTINHVEFNEDWMEHIERPN